MGFKPHHAAKRLVDVEHPARQIPGAQTNGDRVFHRRAQGYFGQQARLHLLAFDDIAA